MEFPPTLWRQGPRSRCTGPKNRDRAQKQLIWLSKKIPWVQNKFMQVHKKYSHRVQKTHRQVPHIFCDPRSKKKIWLGPKNMYKSKKRMPRSKKHASPSFIHLLIRPVQTSIQSYVLPNTHIICTDVASAASVDATWCCGGTGSECVALAA